MMRILGNAELGSNGTSHGFLDIVQYQVHQLVVALQCTNNYVGETESVRWVVHEAPA